MYSLFVVPRKALVKQQLEVFTRFSGIKALGVSSENSSSTNHQDRIQKSDFDILIGTCGAILEQIDRNSLILNHTCCVCFDEAHHAVKKGIYCELLEKVHELQKDEIQNEESRDLNSATTISNLTTRTDVITTLAKASVRIIGLSASPA
eukprot:Awhi_evm1s6102